MGFSIRPATVADAPHWLNLVLAALGGDYPAKELYDVNWIARMLDPANGEETWVAESDGRFQAGISFPQTIRTQRQSHRQSRPQSRAAREHDRWLGRSTLARGQ